MHIVLEKGTAQENIKRASTEKKYEPIHKQPDTMTHSPEVVFTGQTIAIKFS